MFVGARIDDAVPGIETVKVGETELPSAEPEPMAVAIVPAVEIPPDPPLPPEVEIPPDPPIPPKPEIPLGPPVPPEPELPPEPEIPPDPPLPPEPAIPPEDKEGVVAGTTSTINDDVRKHTN